MKNIFKTVNTKIFLLFLVTFFSNLSYGQQRTYQQRLNDLYPGVYFASNPNYNHNGSRTEGVGITEYQEYDQYGDVYYFAIDWDTEALKIPTQSDYDAIYFAILNQQLNDASYQSMMANLDSGYYIPGLADALNSRETFVFMEDLVAGIMGEMAYYDDPFFNQESMSTGVLSAFMRTAFSDTSSQTNFKLTVDRFGNSFVGGTGINVVNGVYTSSGQYLDYNNNSDLVNQLFKGLSDGQKDYLYEQANYRLDTRNAWLDQIFVNKPTNFDKDQFMTDSYESYLKYINNNGLVLPPFTIGATGDYGWNDGSAEKFWSEYMPFTSSFSIWLNGVKTGDKSQMAWGTFLFVADAASFGEGGFLIKGAEVGVLGESAVKAGLLGFVEKTLLQKIDDIAKVWSTKFPIQEMLEGRSYFEDIMGQYRYLKSAGWFHTGEISQFFKGVDFYKGTVVGDKIFAETAVSMKTTITTNVDTWLASAPIQKNIGFLEQGLDATKGLLSNGKTMTINNAEIHIYMPKANITPELTTAWMNKLSTVNPNIRFEIKALEDFIH